MNRAFNQFNLDEDRTGCAQNIRVSKVITHPDYDQQVGSNDIAVLILSSNIDIENKACACALCLRNQVPAKDELCVVSGVGDETERGNGTVLNRIFRRCLTILSDKS